MANGHGGKRVGAGRPRKKRALRALDGNAGHRGRVLQHPGQAHEESAPDPLVVDEEHAPDDLTVDQRLVWLRLGALAVDAGTLTVRYADAFKELCRHVVAEREYWTQTADTMGPNHRGLIRIIQGEMDRFGLRPFGKAEAPAAPAKPTVDPVKERFFGSR